MGRLARFKRAVAGPVGVEMFAEFEWSITDDDGVIYAMGGGSDGWMIQCEGRPACDVGEMVRGLVATAVRPRWAPHGRECWMRLTVVGDEHGPFAVVTCDDGFALVPERPLVGGLFPS